MITFRFRRGTTIEWLATDPILKSGEPGVNLDVMKLKIGDGVKHWSQLSYLSGEGAPGPQGEPGVDGTDGSDGLDGINGVDGASAYDLAVDNGFVGTVDDWLLFLKGDKGDTGDIGPQGIQGNVGAGGAPGAKGDKGDTGDTGPAGADGVDYTGPSISVSSSAPSSPAVGDVWIDTSS